jgi:hypothetical protein
MKKLTIIFSAIAICFGITINTFAQKGKPSSSPTPTPSPTPTDVFVEAKFEPIGSDNTTVNKITMDKALSYVHGAEGVEARFFGASRDLVIRLSNSTRSILVDMTEISNRTADTPSWVDTPFLSKPHMNVLGAYYAKENCKTPVTDTDGNSVYNCDFITRTNGGSWYVSGGVSYALLWNPETINPRPVNSPEKTSLVNVNYYKKELTKKFLLSRLYQTALHVQTLPVKVE